jgi:acetyltransferase
MIDTDFQPIFKPRSVAVIGASSDPMKFGGRAYLTVFERKDQERLYAVNPNVSEITGEKTYARIQDINDEIDHAIVTVPAPFVVQAVADCAEKKVRVVEILTAGFSETGSPEGILWEKQIREIARQNGLRIVGPNCFGHYPSGSRLPERDGASWCSRPEWWVHKLPGSPGVGTWYPPQ